MYYVTKKEKVMFWGKLSECLQYLGDEIPQDRQVKILRREDLTLKQEEWMHKIRRSIHSSASQ
jgi:hypothetical protein